MGRQADAITASALSRRPKKISPRPVRTLVAHTNTLGPTTPVRAEHSRLKSTSRSSSLRKGLMPSGLIWYGENHCDIMPTSGLAADSGVPQVRLPSAPTPSHRRVSDSRARAQPATWASSGSLCCCAACANPCARATAFMAPALVPLTPSNCHWPSSSSASSTPQVSAPCEPPPCSARFRRGRGRAASGIHGLALVHGDHAAHDAVQEPDGDQAPGDPAGQEEQQPQRRGDDVEHARPDHGADAP